jgi:hypothetical protein
LDVPLLLTDVAASLRHCGSDDPTLPLAESIILDAKFRRLLIPNAREILELQTESPPPTAAFDFRSTEILNWTFASDLGILVENDSHSTDHDSISDVE